MRALLHAPGCWATVWREAGVEWDFGRRSGVVLLILLGLSAYLLMVLSHAGYLRELGAADIPRNAPGLVYLMTAGDAFFLIFAWAWIYAQPLLREQRAELLEPVLAAPLSLRALMLGRFLGASGVALLVGSSQVLGFLLSPLLAWIGAVPAQTIAAMPWAAFAWASLVITLPSALGMGALYTLALLRTRSLAGPFGMAALLMLSWMLCMIVMKDGRMDPFWSAVLDPSLFAEAETQVKRWTPAEKSSALLALSPALLLNRLLWCGLPLLALGWALWRLRREQLLPGADTAPQRELAAPQPRGRSSNNNSAKPALRHQRWWRVAGAELGWQCHQLLARRALWLSLAGLLLVALGGGMVHALNHADGPMLPRAELLAPLMSKMMFVLIVIVVAAATGLVMRRDQVAGFGEMLDATPAPEFLRLLARLAAVALLTLLFTLVPGLAGSLLVLLDGQALSNWADPLIYQLAVILPALLEMAAAMVLLHALIRPAGAAYAASMLAAFIFVLNHELDLLSFPPAEFGMPVELHLSPLTGWQPWREMLVWMGAWKLLLCAALLALAAWVLPRGQAEGWRAAATAARARSRGVGLSLAALLLAALALYPRLSERLIEQGGWQSSTQAEAESAQWERAWLGRAAPFRLQGGRLTLSLEPARQQARGEWLIQGLQVEGGWLHAELPAGLRELSAELDGRALPVQIEASLASLPIPPCVPAGCTLRLRWRLDTLGWSAPGEARWLGPQGLWARARDAAPSLGLDPQRQLLAASARSAQGLPAAVPTLPVGHSRSALGIAPAGDWQWLITQAGTAAPLQQGSGHGALDFAAVWAPQAQTTQVAGLSLSHDASRAGMATALAEDVQAMQQCVAARLGGARAVNQLVQLPRGLGEPALSPQGQLLLPELPHWDVAEQGMGRLLRRATIATTLAADALVSGADLRSAASAAAIQEGLAGAIALLCVGDSDGLPALSRLLQRQADLSMLSLSASSTPVGPAERALHAGWARDHLPAAWLAWAAQRSPAELQALASALRSTQSLRAALLSAYPDAEVALLLGPPLAVDVMADAEPAQRSRLWRWRQGAWLADPAGQAADLLQLQAQAGGRLRISPLARGGTPDPQGLLLSALPALERSPQDN
ncbi:hypothetical protein HNP55_004564 [Paucibacter oligotrophus]|uniref:ABC-type transport system involved in multi-copper enzyme maturation permease subunit n=1 Tax=Roseateles oligotrophus TaxID=1769250 RepID=A0A840LCW9_9BURK|nr:ABC transporter permease [Roseateles oligotrophus]MBB4846010.1 hypothetical protein [Roseateles oligotrophus]